MNKPPPTKTIASVVKEDLCTGCGTCVASCPVFAISMVMDNSRGIYVPEINWGICNQCGICFEVCPGHSVDFEQLNMSVFAVKPEDNVLGHYLNCYTGHTTDRSIRYNSASGGLVTTLLIFALEEGLINGALVTSMSRGNPLEPEPFIAKTREEIISAAKSKYCPVPANIALRGILEENGKYAVVGLPCHIHGIRKAAEADRTLKARISLHIGIFCSHTPNFLATEFLLWQRGVGKEEVAKIDYRGEGCPGGLSIYLHNNQRIFISYSDTWEVFNLAFFPRRCLLCCDGAAELADISFGDAWLPEFSDDKSGTSIIVSRTPKGEEFLQRMAMKGIIRLENITAAKVAESQQGFRPKKVNIKLYKLYTKLMRRKIPVYNIKLGKVGLTDAVNASVCLLGLYLSSKRCLWRFVPMLHKRLVPFLGKVQRVFKSRKGDN